MTNEQVVEQLIAILQPIYQEGRLTEDEVNEIFYYATIGNSMVEHGEGLTDCYIEYDEDGKEIFVPKEKQTTFKVKRIL